MNLVVALVAGIISITGGIYSLKNNLFAGQSYGSLQGVIRDSKLAKPLLLVGVEVSTPDGAVVNTAASDQDGRYVIEKLKTGNYEVKFSAPRHTVQTKRVLIEKDFSSKINVDLVPVEEPQKVLPTGPVNENMGVRYPVAQPAYPSQSGVTGQGAYASPAPAAYPPNYPVSPNQNGGSPYDSPQVPSTGRRHHRSAPGSAYPPQSGTGGYDSSGNSGQSSGSLNSTVEQAGLQLVQELFTKKTDKQAAS
jgi:5-hydroxyisourate hydrolase-like protein (transthyretin family)